jgi:hypothetical protein
MLYTMDNTLYKALAEGREGEVQCLKRLLHGGEEGVQLGGSGGRGVGPPQHTHHLRHLERKVHSLGVAAAIHQELL